MQDEQWQSTGSSSISPLPGLEKSYKKTFSLKQADLLLALAKSVSVAFHPLLMPTYGIMLLLNSSAYFSYSLSFAHKSSIVLIVALNTFLLPSLVTLFLWKRKIVANLTMTTIEERRVPYLITAVFYFITYYVLKGTVLPPVIYILMLGATLSVLATLLVNFRWKISAHMVGIGGLLGAFFSVATKLSQPLLTELSFLILIAGLIGFSRLKLSAHTPAQVYAGFFMGMACELLLFYIF